MNAKLKPLGIAVAVAAGYAGVANAQLPVELAAETELGDLALVPYYTVQEGYATGVNIINTSDRTQALKIRFRRAADSMDALDFNVVLSPEDMYTGFIQLSGDDIKFISNDNSCTAPVYPDGGFVMPDIYRDGAETGYIEIMSMGSPIAETYAVAVAAEHDSTGVPDDCASVRDNFFRGGVSGTTRGVVDSALTVQRYDIDNDGTVEINDNPWEASPNSLKVSYFIKSDVTGVEFGDNAVHVEDFFDGPAMTNQQTGVFEGDLCGFDHPDLNGGSPDPVCGATGAGIARYEPLRDTLAATSLINDWSQNSTGDFSVDTDWVVTIPGQYLMLDLPQYLLSLAGVGTPPITCPTVDTPTPIATGVATMPACDFRDIPMSASFTVYDREEQGIVIEEGDLVVSPQPPGEVVVDVLDKEVNVIQWGTAPVLNAPAFIEVGKPESARFGWASLVATSATSKTQSICQYNGGLNTDLAPFGYPALPGVTCTATTTSAPLIGFVAWQRNFAALPAANYGRIVSHSRTQSVTP